MKIKKQLEQLLTSGQVPHAQLFTGLPGYGGLALSIEFGLTLLGEISDSIDRGKHITSHRELIVTENGILIDNPGMREVGIADSTIGLEKTFETIVELSKGCKFNNASCRKYSL